VLGGVGLLSLPVDLVLERLLVLLGGQSAEVIADDYEDDRLQTGDHFLVG
jgi:hypothetical protein